MPSTWEVYACDALPRGFGWAHVEVTGGSPTGKEGEYPTWAGCLDRASFILSFEEIERAKAAL